MPLTVPLEVALVDRLTRGLPRAALQLNQPHTSDAELLRLPGTDVVLALTTDAIVEEVDTGLYDDPYLVGWMTVMASGSDLAAVGASPLGILVSETLPPGLPEDDLARLQQGIGDASRTSGLPVLGGDTSAGDRLHTAGCAVGYLSGAPLTRLGCRPGDRLLASGPLGLGAAFALARTRGLPAPPFLPVARLAEGQLLRGLASAAMDTSDGALATLDELARLNGVGFALESPVENLLHPTAQAAARSAGLPAWLMLAGPHGEFELVFTLSAEHADALQTAAAGLGWSPLELGVVTPEPGLRLADGTRIDTARLRDLFVAMNGDVERYVAELVTSAIISS